MGYVKRNAIAGREFASWEALAGHLQHWLRAVADVRVHGSTGERPGERFQASEAAALRPLAGKAAFLQQRELTRRVHSDACVEVDTNRYSVPWRWIGHQVRVLLGDGQVRIQHAEALLAVHPEVPGRRQQVIDPRHLDGIVGAGQARAQPLAPAPAGTDAPAPLPALLRPLSDDETALGGGW